MVQQHARKCIIIVVRQHTPMSEVQNEGAVPWLSPKDKGETL